MKTKAQLLWKIRCEHKGNLGRMTDYSAFYSRIKMTKNGRDVTHRHHPMTVKRGEHPGNNQG